MKLLILILSLWIASHQTWAKTIVVAVVDTGLDLSHPHFEGHIWQNLGEMGLDQNGQEKKHNGIDDDKNGFIDDVNGYDFSKMSPKMDDENGHGTHVAGIITGQDRQHAPAICQNCVIMPLKYYSHHRSPQQNIRALILAFEYARKMKADLVNYSGGGYGAIDEERMAIENLWKNSIPLVAAAGNFGSSNDEKPYFPASYAISNIISVGALGTNGQRFLKSNDGDLSVHILASGEKLKSSTPGFKYSAMTGSSQAAALTTGWLAQALSNETAQTQQKRRDRKDWIALLADEYARTDHTAQQTRIQIKPQFQNLLATDGQGPSRSLAQLKPQ